MNKNFKVEFFTNESGDWEVLLVNGGDVFAVDGHSISAYDWLELLKIIGCDVSEKEVSDEDMENENY